MTETRPSGVFLPRWQERGPIWRLEPSPVTAQRGTIEFIGGSGLATTPQLSYRRLLEAAARRGWRILAWRYVPGFDHQAQANEAWRAFRVERSRTPPRDGGGDGEAGGSLLRIGHSLGCKLHLLAPDGGRSCFGLVAMSFNNFSAERSIPLLAEMGRQLRFRSEFSPSPRETLRIVSESYRQPRNLLIRFRRDELDQSARLLDALRQRAHDASHLVELPGDHLSPASAGLRRQLLGELAGDQVRQRQIERLLDTIEAWESADF